MSIHTFTMHRDPRNFSPFTDEFWPERWLIAQGSMELPSSIPKVKFVHNAAAFIPFSFGKSLSLEIEKRFLISPPCRPSQLRREAVGDSRYDLPEYHT